MTDPSPLEPILSGHKPILDHFIRRLIGAISQSPLLKARPSKTGRLLDCHRFEEVKKCLSDDVLQGVIERSKPVAVQLDLRALREREKQDHPGSLLFAAQDDEVEINAGIAQEHLRIYQVLERMSRDAELLKRETGRHALWLGYPLLYAAGRESEILAPVFLWPILVRIDLRRQGRVFIERDATISPQFNRAMSSWIHRQFDVQLQTLNGAELSDFDMDAVEDELHLIAARFHPTLPGIDCGALLEPIRSPKNLDPKEGPRFYNSAVIGYFRWQNEAILADLETLRDQNECLGVCGDFLRGTDFPSPIQMPAPPEEDRFLVCDADFSQERVVWQARSHPGMVIHGPPGTGKSQTIVNIIADALAHDRTVLMICQKQAATSVVLKRLRAIGLHDLCLEVRDAAVNRQEVFKEIRKQVDTLRDSSSESSETRLQLSRRIIEVERLLDEHAHALHEQLPRIGLSYKQILAHEGHLLDSMPTLRELPSLHKVLEKLSAREVGDFSPHVQRIGQLFRQADALNNLWRDRQPRVMPSSAMHKDVNVALAELAHLDAEQVQHVERQGPCGPVPNNIANFIPAANEFAERLRRLRDSGSLRLLTLGWLKLLNLDPDVEQPHHEVLCDKGIALARQVSNTRIDTQWDSECSGFTDKQLNQLRRHAQRVAHSQGRRMAFLDPLLWFARHAIKKVRPRVHDLDLWKVAEALFAHLVAKQAREKLTRTNNDLVPSVRPKMDEEAQVKFPKKAKEALAMARWFLAHQSGKWSRTLIDQIYHDPGRLNAILDDLERCILRAPLVDKLLGALKNLEPFLLPKAMESAELSIRAGKSIRPWLERLETDLTKLEHLIAWDLGRRHPDGHLGEIVEALEAYDVQRIKGEKLPAPDRELTPEQYGDWWSALIKYSAMQIWKRECQLRHPVLLQVLPEVHQKARDELRELLEKKRGLEAASICRRWLDRQILFRDRPWAKRFQLKTSKQSKAPRLREAVGASLHDGLLAMRPCWLVSPEAAAQIFPLQSGLFDLVIFDEASQCPIEQAVPAIYRGKTLIVAGDEKQLPPTDFFSSRSDEITIQANDAEEAEATDEVVRNEQRRPGDQGARFMFEAEDLLEAAICNLPPTPGGGRLMVHYRSEHPDLIEFSNRAFYQGQLEAPPSQLSRQSDSRPIVYLDVGGLYSDRTNRKEAEKVIELLKGLWAREGLSPTIGVVTFNQPQRELIEDLIEEICHTDEAFAARCEQEKGRQEENQDVGFFVKNLENVQGDERDVIIFSTTFNRRRPSGNLDRRFGPVGQNGGERRLNVAVTRAKKQIFVVSSMPIDEVSSALGAGSAPGTGITPAGYLQLYLAYAKAVSEGDLARRNYVLDLLNCQSAPLHLNGETESPLEEEVRQALEKMGHNVHCQVGESGFRIDLAVLHPNPVLGYLLGIECDGATYHSSRSARIRDVWREKILRKRGWQIHRIWSTRWWFRRADEIEKLNFALSEAAAQMVQSVTPVDSKNQANKPIGHDLIAKTDEIKTWSRGPTS
jgi:very-short-patch-repair endonuclease